MANSNYKKFNVGLIIIVFLSSCGFILWLYFGANVFDAKFQWLERAKDFRFLLGLPIVILVAKIMILKRTWDYLFLNLGLWSFLFLFTFPEINELLLALTHQTDNVHLWPVFYTSGVGIFSLFFFLSVVFTSQPFHKRHFPLAIILAHVLGFLALISFILVLLFFTDPLLGKNGIFPLLSFVTQAIFLFPAGIKFFLLYLKKEDRIYFWFTLAAIFFMVGFSSYTFILLEYNAFSQIDHL